MVYRVKNLEKSFGENQVLKKINFEVEANEKIVIIGPSGGGKSTLLRCLNLLEEPVAPVVTILITNNSDQILPTVRSRTQIINFDNGERASGRTAVLLENGFSKAEIEELGNLDKWNQAIKYFYQEMLEHNSLALVSAHKLAADAKLVSEQGYILLQLKLLAEQDLRNPAKRIMAATMLKNLIEIDKMRLSNVNLQNALDYLALKWK